MEKTLKMMKSILNGKEEKVDEKELIIEYQEKLSPNILAYFYCNNFGIILKTSKLYPIINIEDSASFCLQELDKCLQNFDLDKNNKFITYFIKCYKFRLRTEIESLHLQKSKILLKCDDLSKLENVTIEQDMNSLNDVLNCYDLTNIEKKLCKLLEAGYKIKEIANMVNMQKVTIYKQREKIKEKILNSSINFA